MISLIKKEIPKGAQAYADYDRNILYLKEGIKLEDEERIEKIVKERESESTR